MLSNNKYSPATSLGSKRSNYSQSSYNRGKTNSVGRNTNNTNSIARGNSNSVGRNNNNNNINHNAGVISSRVKATIDNKPNIFNRQQPARNHPIDFVSRNRQMFPSSYSRQSPKTNHL